MTTDIDRAEVFSRPAARFDEDGQFEIRASSSLGCRRALWYAATGYQPTNPPTEESLTAMEAGNALEPVALRAMERAGWEVTPADPQDPQQVSVRVGPNMVVTGHPDATGVVPMFGGETVIEVKTRGRRRSSDGAPWARSAATRRRWPKPPSTPWGPTGSCGTR